jgi:tRNA-modifying protein YgfZ
MMTANLSDRAKFLLRGPDRVRYLNGQVTNNVAALRAGESCYALVCTHKGKLEGDVFIHARDDRLIIDADGSLRDPLAARLSKYIIADDCELVDVTDEWALFHEPGGDASERRAHTDHTESTGVLCFATTRFGVPGLDYWSPSGVPGFTADLSADDIELLRLEHGVPVWGAELTRDVLPQEARLQDRAVDFLKGCYVGQEVISRIKGVGRVTRELQALETSDAATVLRAGDKLFAGDPSVEAGVVTSARFHPRLQKTIALGYVKRTLGHRGAVFRAGPDQNQLSGPVTIRDTSATSESRP